LLVGFPACDRHSHPPLPGCKKLYGNGRDPPRIELDKLKDLGATLENLLAQNVPDASHNDFVTTLRLDSIETAKQLIVTTITKLNGASPAPSLFGQLIQLHALFHPWQRMNFHHLDRSLRYLQMRMTFEFTCRCLMRFRLYDPIQHDVVLGVRGAA